jgi:hypothetical protein
MEELVSANQSAFIIGRNLHDNFMLVRQLTRKINARKEIGVLLKLDISRAFDSLSWSFLFEILRCLGFPPAWLRWMEIAMRTASTKVIVNGSPGRKIAHVRGLRQGDPLSLQLFVTATEVITKLFCRAADQGYLMPIGNCMSVQRISVYADNVVLFFKLEVTDLVAVRELLRIFGQASGLQVNYNKTAATMIRGDVLDRHRVMTLLNCQISEFPIRYLGLPLALQPLTKSQWQPLLDATVRLVPAWMRGMIARPGRLVLIKFVIAARPLHQLLILEAPVWLLEDIGKSMRGFF